MPGFEVPLDRSAPFVKRTNFLQALKISPRRPAPPGVGMPPRSATPRAQWNGHESSLPLRPHTAAVTFSEEPKTMGLGEDVSPPLSSPALALAPAPAPPPPPPATSPPRLSPTGRRLSPGGRGGPSSPSSPPDRLVVDDAPSWLLFPTIPPEGRETPPISHDVYKPRRLPLPTNIEAPLFREVFSVLRKTRVFRSVMDKDLEKVVALGRVCDYPRYSALVREGTAGASLFVVLAGMHPAT